MFLNAVAADEDNGDALVGWTSSRGRRNPRRDDVNRTTQSHQQLRGFSCAYTRRSLPRSTRGDCPSVTVLRACASDPRADTCRADTCRADACRADVCRAWPIVASPSSAVLLLLRGWQTDLTLLTFLCCGPVTACCVVFLAERLGSKAPRCVSFLYVCCVYQLRPRSKVTFTDILYLLATVLLLMHHVLGVRLRS